MTIKFRGRATAFSSQMSKASKANYQQGSGPRAYFKQKNSWSARNPLNSQRQDLDDTSSVVRGCFVEAAQLQGDAKDPASMQFHPWFLQF